MVHVTDVQAGLDWYEKAFPSALRKSIIEPFFEYLDVNGMGIEIVSADEKVTAGAAGTVVYWQVKDFDAELRHMQSIGATLHRGPLKIEDEKRMCQLRDPWGNCIGLRG